MSDFKHENERSILNKVYFTAASLQYAATVVLVLVCTSIDSHHLWFAVLADWWPMDCEMTGH